MLKKAIIESKSGGKIRGYRLNLPKESGFKKDDIAVVLSEEEYDDFQSLIDENEKLKQRITQLEHENLQAKNELKENLTEEIIKITDKYMDTINTNNDLHEEKIIQYERKLGLAINTLNQINQLSILEVLRRKYKTPINESLHLLTSDNDIEL